MAPFVVRRSERIDYRVPVTLFAVRDNVAPVSARSIDVSEGGMRVFAPSSLSVPVGATVRCELTLDGRSAMLEGTVAWLADHSAAEASHDELDDAEQSRADLAQDATPRLGMGIRFETLSREDTGVLRHLVARATEGYMPAELDLSGVRAKVAARAVPTATGARISASLPWLRRGASVGVRFVGAPADVHGRIADAVLQEMPTGGRRLQIEVEADAPTRERRNTQYGDALDFERPRIIESDAAHAPRLSLEPPPERPRAWLALFAGVVLGSAVTFAGMALWPATSSLLRARSDAHGATHSRRAAMSSPVPSASPAAAKTQERIEAAQPIDVELAQPPEAPQPIEIAPAHAIEATAATAATQKIDATQPLATQPSLLEQPTLETLGATSIVRIPFHGSLTKMIVRVWAEPYALAIDLPDAETTLEPGRYPLQGPLAAFVRVQKSGSAQEGTHASSSRTLRLRIGLSQPLAGHSVSASDNALEIRLTAREASTPTL